MTISKHKALQEWIAPFLDDNYLYFESADAYPNIRMIVPQYGDYVRKTDICGFKYKTYTFVFIAFERIDNGTSDTNITNMELMDSFTSWLETQQSELNFPDFGENCSDYEIKPVQDMANLATVTEEGLAKYMLAVKINYKEE